MSPTFVDMLACPANFRAAIFNKSLVCIAVVWSGSTQLGCGWARCPEADGWAVDVIVCRYKTYGNIYRVSDDHKTQVSLFLQNVKPTRCQTATGDPWWVGAAAMAAQHAPRAHESFAGASPSRAASAAFMQLLPHMTV